MAVTIISCYFLPLLFFFLAQIAFPKSILACVLGIASLSIASLVLYIQWISKKNHPKPQAVSSPKILKIEQPILAFAKKSLLEPSEIIPTNASHKKEEEMQQALLQQKTYYVEEIDKHQVELETLKRELESCQDALFAKDAQNKKQAKELEDLKFEMYTLLRIESYVQPKTSDSDDANKLAAASF